MEGERQHLVQTIVDELYSQEQKTHDKTWWKVIHALAFLTGGITFVIGTGCYFPYDYNWTLGFKIAGISYTIGSAGFLTVDVLEFFTFTEDRWLRLNIFASATGSLCYLIGSLFFIPELQSLSHGSDVGVWGFILGSAFIAASQFCKVIRIIREKPIDSSAIGVEGGAFLGAAFFLVGTILFRDGLVVASREYVEVLVLWILGSIFFTVGGIFLTIRHACMGK
ncbi:hypothetical protein PROFUN_10902 [Planoprotostelium fungivorum]|uniref:Uncharacterized protein n=1 Tax=Planoprotostelium fungivorum TaxID=1890364 RepID=A0A2P6NC66_9EUKA|nr:hypothetical protein PROFUN_10902 [Planoprotostelium fungivorum]